MDKKDLDLMGGVIVRVSQDTDGRVWIKDVTVEQPKEVKMKYKVGDRVEIKSWEEMKKEYGVDECGDIAVSKSSFTSNMRKYCGKIMTIARVNVGDYGRYWYYNMREDNEEWFWNNKMIKGLATKRTVIKYRELKDGIIEIVGWENVLKRDELPEEYFKGPNYYLTTGGEIRLNAENYITFLRTGSQFRLTKPEFSQRIKDMKQAGNRLGKILCKPKIKKVVI